jgi:hypothetical protein
MVATRVTAVGTLAMTTVFSRRSVAPRPRPETAAAPVSSGHSLSRNGYRPRKSPGIGIPAAFLPSGHGGPAVPAGRRSGAYWSRSQAWIRVWLCTNGKSPTASVVVRSGKPEWPPNRHSAGISTGSLLVQFRLHLIAVKCRPRGLRNGHGGMALTRITRRVNLTVRSKHGLLARV